MPSDPPSSGVPDPTAVPDAKVAPGEEVRPGSGQPTPIARGVEQARAEERAGPADSMIAASRSMVGGRSPPPRRSGVFELLPAMGRAYRAWRGLGLVLGRRLATVIRDAHV